MEYPQGRSLDVFVADELVSIDLDNLDPNPDDVLVVLQDPQGRTEKVAIWTKLASEYWKQDYLDAAEKIADVAIHVFEARGRHSDLPPMYCLYANIQLAKARQAPKLILQSAREDILKNVKGKEELYKAAALRINSSDSATASRPVDPESPPILQLLTRGIHQLATRSLDDAMRSFENVLEVKPTNLIALLGKARILYARRNYATALSTFQLILRLNPHCQPDPRIGIGLCLWALDQKAKAKLAWERSLELNPSDWSAQILLGLEAINSSKNESMSDQERTQAFLYGTKLVEKAFNTNRTSAAAANALSELFLLKNNLPRALKLAERTIQFADTLTVLTEGYTRAGRASHGEGYSALATKYYSSAIEGQPKQIVGAIGLAQMQIKNDEMAAAIHTLDTLLQPPNPVRSFEATVILASLRAFPRPGISVSDGVAERARARELYDRVLKAIDNVFNEDNKSTSSSGYLQTTPRSARTIGDDLDMHVEMARLWQTAEGPGSSNERPIKTLKEAIRIAEAAGKVDPRLFNNLGVLHHLEGKLTDARGFYDNALRNVTAMSPETSEAMSTTMLYNFARVHEDLGEETAAKDMYEKLLSRHPEYTDAKIRQAHMLSALNRSNEAHELLKQSLASQGSNLNLRAYYTHFLIQSNLPKVARDFVFLTLRDFDKHDLYSLCAAGWVLYIQARENREQSSKGSEERRKNYQRSAEFYEKALQLDPTCAIAAQGLAIITAEDTLPVGAPPITSSADEAQRRMKTSREALDVFAKVRESIHDGSVYLNMGHCYYARDEFDHAIESYETASTRFYGGHNVTVLLCLCRSWYSKGMKDQSYSAMCTAVRYAQMALHIQPGDKAVLYNIAMIQQKCAEMLFSLPPPKRALKDLQRVIEQGSHAQRVFASLAADKATMVPYSREIADQRRKYGDNMLKKGEDHLSAQRTFENEAQAKLDAARQTRMQEKDRLDALERERLEQLKIEAERIAAERRQAREIVQQWTAEQRADSDDEKERRPRKTKKAKTDAGGSGDEAPEPKKKRRGKLKKLDGEIEGRAGSDDEEERAPVKKRANKKRVIRDDDEEEEAAAPKKKQFKSSEFVRSEDEMSE